MLYLKWFVNGRPEAPKSDPKVAAAIKKQLGPLEEQGHWEQGLALLQETDPTRAASLNRNDWYRLQRALEIAQLSTVPFHEVSETRARLLL